jgi:hypothetical protein
VASGKSKLVLLSDAGKYTADERDLIRILVRLLRDEAFPLTRTLAVDLLRSYDKERLKLAPDYHVRNSSKSEASSDE